MHYKIIGFIISGWLLFVSLTAKAQTDYLAEIGVNGGLSYLIDDKSSLPFQEPAIDWGLIYRHNFNERFSAHLEFNSTKQIFYAGSALLPVDTIGLNMFDLCGEFNFFDLIKKEYKIQSRSFSPYIFAGAGWAFNSNSNGFNLPFGVGFKYKVGHRINLNAKWANRLMFHDRIEGIEGKLNGTNFLKNDLISTFTIGVSYDFWKRPCDCQNRN